MCIRENFSRVKGRASQHGRCQGAILYKRTALVNKLVTTQFCSPDENGPKTTYLKIAVFGTDPVGQTIADKLNSLGHDVVLGTRDPKASLQRVDKDSFGRPPLKDWHKEHPTVKIATFAEAAAHGEFLVNATNGTGTLPALAAACAHLAGKVLLDNANPLDFSKGSSRAHGRKRFLGEQVQRAYPDLNVVKSLNTMNPISGLTAFASENPYVFRAGTSRRRSTCGNCCAVRLGA